MKATLDTGEVIEGDMLTVFFNHTQHFGSKMRATPLAQLDDGRFEVLHTLCTTTTISFC
jgi:diacylglycerol kinase family enzyme